MLAKIAPGLNSKSCCSWLKTLTPVTSVGSRSGVNWMRRNEQSIERAIAFASIVLPTPGTSSISRWPSANRATSARRISASLPRTTCLDVAFDLAEPLGEALPVLRALTYLHGHLRGHGWPDIVRRPVASGDGPSPVIRTASARGSRVPARRVGGRVPQARDGRGGRDGGGPGRCRGRPARPLVRNSRHLAGRARRRRRTDYTGVIRRSTRARGPLVHARAPLHSLHHGTRPRPQRVGSRRWRS